MSANAKLPAWLAQPLASNGVLGQIIEALTTREQQRHECAAQVQAGAAQTRSRLTPSRRTSDSGGASSGRDYARFSMSEGLKDEHMSMNRYRDIVAFDRTRILSPTPAYVNASLVREPDLGVSDEQLPRRWWVASQAPIESTVSAFLSLLLSPPTSSEHIATSSADLPLINLIVQLTPLVEQGRSKCHPYFPRTIGETMRLPHGPAGEEIWVRLHDKVEKNGIRTSRLTVGKGGDSTGRSVTHVEYRGWGDHGIPSDAAHLVNFTKDMLALNASLSSGAEPSPILIGCSAGVGRTGTFITIASLLPLLKSTLPPLRPLPPTAPDHPLGPYPTEHLERLGVLPRDFVGLTIDGLREQRTTMVQTASQILFCFQALECAWKQRAA